MKPNIPLFNSEYTVLEDQTIMDMVKEISARSSQEDPFYVLDVGDIVQKVKNWRLKMPRVKPFYAVKCNDDSTVLEVLAALGTGFDCASKGEMRKVIDMGVAPNRIIFAHPCKPSSHIRVAAKMGVNLMTFDNEAELHKVKSIMPDASLVIRIRCDALKAQCPLGVKFGVLPQDASYLLDVAKSLDLNIAGVSFHVGSGCGEPQVFLRAIEAARHVFDEAITRGFKPYLLDIGGGFAGDRGTSLDEVAHYINTALELHFPHDSEVEVIAEPGRYMVASAFTLCTQIISKRMVNPTYNNQNLLDEESCMYYVNDGVYGSFNCILYDHQVVMPYPVYQKENDSLLASSVWGPTCDGLDQVIERVLLPRMELGDWMAWDNMGAYTISAAGTFNGFPIADVYTVMQEHTYLFLYDLIERERALQGEIEDLGCLSDVEHQAPILIKMIDALEIGEFETVKDI